MNEMEPSLESEKYLKWKAERLQRYRLIMAVVPAIIGSMAIVYNMLAPSYDDTFYSRTMTLVGPGALLISCMAIIMTYLQTGFKRQSELTIDYEKYDHELRNLRSSLEHSSKISSSELSVLQGDILQLKEQLKNRESISEAITAEHKEELVDLLKTEILNESYQEASSDILKNIESLVASKNNLREVEKVFFRTIDRLYSEINSLTRRGNLNLSLGVITTIIGLLILGYFVLEIGSIPEDKMAFIANFIPRLSLVVLIEVFAYFFLKLYKSSLSEIKYFQNEMTNVEAKLAAIKCSIIVSDNIAISSVIQALTTTERNALLEKGQTTAEIEKSRIEHQNISVLSEKVSNFIGIRKQK
ncbi:hypothetical protein I5Q12_02245 [Serratia marcescens]|uniref:hypothetical protein n=1 Tax=Serratia TaxID=613 RepID=UPI0010C56CB2|nr:hypothetical protein AS657_09025 [Serratia marcescens]MBH2723634.1 hypothetical protein [Serratia marcescens]MBH2814127.1 hypothetical protein [Serratia marcescens]BEO32393.1 hypothetical protein SMQE01_11580 [Serratia marcescens]HEI9782066.1 hypothetical protein [Serratia marcescens]